MGTEDCARCGRQVVLLNQALVGGVGGAVAGVTRRRSVLVGYKFQTYDQNTVKSDQKVVFAPALGRWDGKFNVASSGIGQQWTCGVPQMLRSMGGHSGMARSHRATHDSKIIDQNEP